MSNRFGVDVEYYTKDLKRLIKSLPDRTPEELKRYFESLAKSVNIDGVKKVFGE